MPSPPESNRRRRWAPKTRTGCTTCKIRKKKCSEERPSCSRCLKDKFQCEYDAPPKAWTFEPKPKRQQHRPSKRQKTALYGRGYLHLTATSSSSSGHGSEDSVDQHGVGKELAVVNQEPATCNLENNALRRRNKYLSSSPFLLEDFDFLLEPSTPFAISNSDAHFTQFFMLKTAPLLCSTRGWEQFWQSIVPQAAWTNPSIHHAMIALALTFDTYLTGTDHADATLSRRNRAIKAFRTQPSTSWEVGLIICRMFACMAQCSEDWDGAKKHLKMGERILWEATMANGKTSLSTQSDIPRLMAATFFGLSASEPDSLIVSDDAAWERFPPGPRRRAYLDLKAMSMDYTALIKRISHSFYCHEDKPTSELFPTWKEFHKAIHSGNGTHDHSFPNELAPSTMGFLSVAFTTMNQALSSAMYPDLLDFSDEDGIVHVEEIRAQLSCPHGNEFGVDMMMTLDELRLEYRALFGELEATLSSPGDITPAVHPDSCIGPEIPTKRKVIPPDLKFRLRRFVDNYVLAAHDELEPRMTAGTFWLPDNLVSCCILTRTDKSRAKDGTVSCCLSSPSEHNYPRRGPCVHETKPDYQPTQYRGPCLGVGIESEGLEDPESDVIDTLWQRQATHRNEVGIASHTASRYDFKLYQDDIAFAKLTGNLEKFSAMQKRHRRILRERREYYHEFVCEYRSGFMC